MYFSLGKLNSVVVLIVIFVSGCCQGLLVVSWSVVNCRSWLKLVMIVNYSYLLYKHTFSVIEYNFFCYLSCFSSLSTFSVSFYRGIRALSAAYTMDPHTTSFATSGSMNRTIVQSSSLINQNKFTPLSTTLNLGHSVPIENHFIQRRITKID